MDEETRSLLARRHLLAVGLALVALAFLVVALSMVIGEGGWGYDFEAYFKAAQRIGWSESPYVSFTLEQRFRPGGPGLYLYAPPLAVGTLPFTALHLPTATILWFLVRVALLAIACAVMPVRPMVRLLVFAVAAFSQPVLQDLVLGNVSVLVVVALAFAWRGLDRPMGSIATAVAMSVRPTLGILLIWWALRRRWRALLTTLVAGGLLILATLPFVGPQAYFDYLTMLGNLDQVTGVPNNLDLASTVLRFNLHPVVATAALYGGYVIAIGAMLISLRFDRDLSFMVTISATLLLAPLLWDHYLSSLLLPAAFLAQRGRTWGLALPLLAWLPSELLPLVAIVGTVAPFLAERRPGIDPPALSARPAALPPPVVAEPAPPMPVPARTPPAIPDASPLPAPSGVPMTVGAAQLEASAPAGSNTTSSPS